MKLLRPLHSSYCFYAAVFGVIAGAAVSLIIHKGYCSSPIWLLVALIFFFTSVSHPSYLMLPVGFCAGLILANFRSTPLFNSEDTVQALSGEIVTISGQIADDPDLNSSAPTLHLTKLRLSSPTSTQPISGTLYVKLARTADLKRSDYLVLRGKLSPGFGTFLGSLMRPEVLEINRTEYGDIFADFKNFFAVQVQTHLASPQAELGLGYLMGMKSGLPTDFSENLRAVGMTHVVVASGAHLAILIGLIKKSFGRISRVAGLAASLLMIFAFAAVIGFTPSMTRASLVASLSLLVGFVGRKFTPFRLLSLVAAVTLLIDPSNLLNLGWQLSFASFFGILMLTPRLQKLLYGGKKLPWLASMLITSLSTSLICAPILIYNFGSFSLLSFVANLIILPTLPYAMLATFLVGATSFLPFLANLLAFPATFLLNLHIQLINFLSTKTNFILNFSSVSPLIFLFYLPIILFLIFPTIRQTIHTHHLAKKRELCYNKVMKVASETEMIALGQKLAQSLSLPAVIELVGDVGAGKTTFTRGLAVGLGISEPVTSPSFTISKRYSFSAQNNQPGELIHYDFYRLDDPGIMREELAEAIAEQNSVVVVEWGNDVADLLPKQKIQLEFILQPDGSRTVASNHPEFLS